MRILIGCERSNEVRSRFENIGFDAWSCDTDYNAKIGVKHLRCSIFDIINDGWDAMICFPPCTHLASAGCAFFEQKRKDGRQQQGIDFFMAMINAPIKYIAVENPVGIMSGIYRKPDQIIEPYYFGDKNKKSTCLWLKNLPKLYYTLEDNLFGSKTSVEPDIVTPTKTGKRYSKHEYEASKNHKYRQQIRSKTFPGIAQAMADQWGSYLLKSSLTNI